MKPNLFEDDTSTCDEWSEELSTSGDRDDGINVITSKMFDLMGKPISAFPDDVGDVSFEKLEGQKHGNSNQTRSLRKMKESKIQIPGVEASHLIAQTVDKAWAREFFEIHKEKRESIFEELHGVRSRAVPETQETIRSGLLAMEQKIVKIVTATASPSASRASRNLVEGHLLATEILRSEYVVAPEFRLRFLRAEFYDANKAARRYFKNLNYLLRLFGKYALMRPLELSDLSIFQRRCVESGKIQVLLHRDRMGRRMILVHGLTLTRIPILDRFRVETYLVFGAIAEDEETQLQGAICITTFHPNGGPGGDDEKEKSTGIGEELEQQQEQERYDRHQRKSSGLLVEDSGWDETEKKILKKLFRRNLQGHNFIKEHSEASPIRWAAIHICVPDNRVYRFFKAVMLGMIPSNYRYMTKIHVGSQLECIYGLLQFGIPAEDLGMSTVKSKSLGKFLRARTSVEDFRKDFYSKHGLQYYRTPPELLREQQQQQQDLQQSQNFNETTTNEGTQPASSVPSTGSVKLPSETNFSLSTNCFCPGTDCPASNYVVFGDRLTYKYPANSEFREYVREFLRKKTATENGGNKKTKDSLRLKVQILDQIIDETCAVSYPDTSRVGANKDGAIQGDYSLPSKRFMFATYDKGAEWYRYMLPFHNECDRIELRKRISQTLRDDRKKRTLMNSNNRANRHNLSSTNTGSIISSAFPYTDDTDRAELLAKRLKTDHNQPCWSVFGPALMSDW